MWTLNQEKSEWRNVGVNGTRASFIETGGWNGALLYDQLIT